MIRVNLIGGARPAAGKTGRGVPSTAALLPVLWVLVILGTAAYGYFWYTGLVAESADLSAQIETATAQRAELQEVIDADAVYQQRVEMLEARVAAIEELQRNQASPVVVLDMLSRAINETEYVWLTQLGQNGTALNMAGSATSEVAVADFITSLQDTGYFRNINLGNLQEVQETLWSFQMAVEFLPPALPGNGAGDQEGESSGAGAE